MRTAKTRLRWVREKAQVKSELVFAGKDIIHVTISLSPPFTYSITDGEKTFGEGKHTTLRKAKREAKEHLKRMNARFYDEVRPYKKSR